MLTDFSVSLERCHKGGGVHQAPPPLPHTHTPGTSQRDQFSVLWKPLVAVDAIAGYNRPAGSKTMTVETASVSSSSCSSLLLVPPKKRDFSDYPLQADMDLSAHSGLHHHLRHGGEGPPTPPEHTGAGRHGELSPSTSSSSSSSSMPCKSEPIKSGFMITDILSPHSSGGLRLSPLAAAHHHLVRLPSPHGTASSDAGSYKENDDMSDDGEGRLRIFLKQSFCPQYSVHSMRIYQVPSFLAICTRHPLLFVFKCQRTFIRLFHCKNK